MWLPLADADDRCGAKARGLRALVEWGFAVPDGIVLPDAGTPGWEDDLERRLPALGPGPFAVRSSSPDEDGATASYAGLFRTELGPRCVAEVVAAVRRVAGSAATAPARVYAAALGVSTTGVVPVIVQRLVEPEVAGVAFGCDPVSGAEEIVLEAVAGRGDRLVDGAVTPERWRRTAAGTARESDGPALLALDQVRRVVDAVQRVGDLAGGPQDVEWALACDRLWLLQSRPVTALVPRSPVVAAATDGDLLATGVPASPGTVEGTARVVADLDAHADFRADEVLVCRSTSPAWLPLLARAAAVVTEHGGLLAHAAIVARELGIPAVTGATDVLAAVADGEQVHVDGTHGTVRRAKRGPR
ncbi:PEP/pyruvate-binding domain-containing protein [Nocardioides humi]|uniref:Pyruvate, water dikinase n=1 Tax=Nocardioides humi TaxID=449461 RepID=A0ABN2AU77_9ACTN|nr:PEP/pyruvate-binding domain-containing protein [Nocardioides humi]